MTVEGNGVAFAMSTADYDSGTRRAVKTFDFPAAGSYSFSLQLYRNASGVAFMELSCAKGEVAASAFSTDTFHLVGLEGTAPEVEAPVAGKIDVSGGKVTISIGNAKAGVRYGYRFAERLQDVDTAAIVWLDDSAVAGGDLSIELNGATPSGFFRLLAE